MKQKTNIILQTICLLFAVGLGSLFKLPAPDSVTTKPNSHEPVAAHSSSDTSTSDHSQSSPSKHAVQLASATPPPEPKPPIQLASKQEAIKQTIAHEYLYRILATPNDPQYPANWALAKVNAPAAWNIATGSSQTIIAVIDSGFALAHEDLSNSWYTNPGENGTTQQGGRCWTGVTVSKQANSCDDDNNGYVDDWRGWSFALEDNNPQAGRENPAGDGAQHGTMVAGLAGAGGNNATGMTAINWNTRIMPLQALSDEGLGYTSDVTAAIYYAVDNGASVINLSLGGYANDPAMRNAVNYATSHNVVVVAAAGNCGDGSGPECQGVPAGTVAYPAALPDVIAVGASTQSDTRASFGSFGPSLDVSAPGYAVPSSTSWSAGNPTSLYSSSIYGTSFASPQVASLASLIRSIRPSSSVQDITAIIDATASKPAGMNGAMYSQQFGHGIINAYAALTIAGALNSSAGSVPVLAQAGSFQAEHIAPSGSLISSGCEGTVNSACTIQMTNPVSGYKRYLPYAVIPAEGTVGWSWSSTALDSGSWDIRALSGEHKSTTPYSLFRN